MDQATVFSRSRVVAFAQPVARDKIAEDLKNFLGNIGERLAVDKIILGHIKMAACFSDAEDFIFFSMTNTERIDVKFSPRWHSFAGDIEKAALDINVLIFGPSPQKVSLAVDSAWRRFRQKPGGAFLKGRKHIMRGV